METEQVQILNANEDVTSVIRNLSRSREESFFVLNIDDLVKKHRNWKAVLPRVQPHYAVKCNDSQTVLEVLAALGAGFDCASKGEIDKVLALGVEPNRIIFANPARLVSHIQHASDVGVKTLTFDNEVELHKVKRLFPDAKLVIRIKVEAKAKFQLGLKFGCDAETEAPALIQLAHQLGLDLVGVSFHVGSGCETALAFRDAITASRKLFDYASTLGYHLHLLDIGGGYPGERGTSITEMARVINQALDDFFPDPSVHVISEPGRYYVASAYTLACNVYSIRQIPIVDSITGQPDVHYMYYLNDGVYSSLNCVLFDHRCVVGQPLKNYSHGKTHVSTLWGPTCDSLDLIAENILLPKMDVGDWLVFEDMGAYTLPIATTFNGFPVAKVHNVISKRTWLLLKNVLAIKNATKDNCYNQWAVSPIIKQSLCHENILQTGQVCKYIHEL